MSRLLRRRGEWSPDKVYRAGDVVRRSSDSVSPSEIAKARPLDRLFVAIRPNRAAKPESGFVSYPYAVWRRVPLPPPRGVGGSEGITPADRYNPSILATDGLRSFWPFDDAGPVAADLGPAGQDWTVESGSPEWQGKDGYLRLTGENNIIRADNEALDRVLTGGLPWTWEWWTWVDLDPEATEPFPFDIEQDFINTVSADGDDYTDQVYIDNNATRDGGAGADTPYLEWSPPTADYFYTLRERWCYSALRFDGQTLSSWTNIPGEDGVDQSAPDGVALSADDHLTLGDGPGDGAQWQPNMGVARMAYYERSLSEEDIRARMAAGVSGQAAVQPRTSVRDRGEWSSERTYLPGDFVTRSGEADESRAERARTPVRRGLHGFRSRSMATGVSRASDPLDMSDPAWTVVDAISRLWTPDSYYHHPDRWNILPAGPDRWRIRAWVDPHSVANHGQGATILAPGEFNATGFVDPPHTWDSWTLLSGETVATGCHLEVVAPDLPDQSDVRLGLGLTFYNNTHLWESHELNQGELSDGADYVLDQAGVVPGEYDLAFDWTPVSGVNLSGPPWGASAALLLENASDDTVLFDFYVSLATLTRDGGPDVLADGGPNVYPSPLEGTDG